MGKEPPGAFVTTFEKISFLLFLMEISNPYRNITSSATNSLFERKVLQSSSGPINILLSVLTLPNHVFSCLPSGFSHSIMDGDYDDLGRPKPLSGEEIEEFRRAFKMFDSDSSGTISAQELILVMENLNMNPSEKDISGLLKVQKKEYELVFTF